MAEFQTDPLAACYALAEAATPSHLREILLATMVGLSRASVGLMLGRADTGEFVQLGALPAMFEDNLPDLAEIEREQHPLAAVLTASGPLMEAAGGSLGVARAAVFDMPGRLLAIPANAGDRRIDLVFLLLLPLVVGPSPADIAALSAFANHGARLNRLLLRVQTEGTARQDLSRALDRADQNRARVLTHTLPSLLAGRLVGRTQAMQDLRRDIAKFGQSRLPVLVTGETGTGKELVARELHRISDRGDKPLIAINVAALPADLLESELFGHVRGAFTGATGNRKGLIAEADKGTLFLDEIGDMPLPLQAKLLRVVQEKRFRPVGADKETGSDFRLICATHRDLAAAVEEGSFRQDLFYRIAPVHLTIAPLRERTDDMEPLAAHFLNEIARRDNTAVKTLGTAALEGLRQQSFPGNVRELQSVIERAVLQAGEASIVELAHLNMSAPVAVPTLGSIPFRLLDGGGLTGARERFERFLIMEEFVAAEGDRHRTAQRLGIPIRTLNRKLGAETTRQAFANHALAQDFVSALAPTIGNVPIDLRLACEEFERQLILNVHEATSEDRRQMAEQLGLSLSTLSEKLKHHDIPSQNSLRGSLK